MLFDTVAEYNEEIANVRTSIKRSLLVGQHSKNVTTTERANTEVDIDKAQAYLRLLISERNSLGSNLCGRTIGVGW